MKVCDSTKGRQAHSHKVVSRVAFAFDAFMSSVGVSSIRDKERVVQ